MKYICCDTPNLPSQNFNTTTGSYEHLALAADCQEVCGRPFSRQEAILMAKGEMDPRTRQPKRLEALTNAERRAIDLMLADKRSEQSDYRHQVALEDWILFLLDQSVCGV